MPDRALLADPVSQRLLAPGRDRPELLGGRVRDKVRMYTHFGGATPEAMARNARVKVERGWTALKTVPVPLTRMLDGPAVLKTAEAGVRAVREAIGDDVDLLLDLHGRLTPQMAIQYGKVFEPYHPLFLEEPCQAENPAAMAPVARALSTPIATGERLFTRWGFREILEQCRKSAPARYVSRGRYQRGTEDRDDGRGILRRHRAA